ncbi:MAG TPA: hypothetical protein VII30_07715 [Gemmatimonadaceae bacterium]
MSDNAIAALRWVILGSVLVSVLQATVLFNAFERWVYRPWFAMSERAGGRVPAIMRDGRIHRISAIIMAVVMLVTWWYLGTPAGVQLMRKSGLW